LPSAPRKRLPIPLKRLLRKFHERDCWHILSQRVTCYQDFVPQ
jgi:hypothetical protein